MSKKSQAQKSHEDVLQSSTDQKNLKGAKLRNEMEERSRNVEMPEDSADERAPHEKQSLGLEETKEARKAEKEALKAKRREARPTSVHGMYGNTKPVSSFVPEQPHDLKTGATKDGDLSLLRNRD